MSYMDLHHTKSWLKFVKKFRQMRTKMEEVEEVNILYEEDYRIKQEAEVAEERMKKILEEKGKRKTGK